MFESIAFSARSTPGQDIDVGDLAENLLYYGKVHLLGNSDLIAKLVSSVGTLQLLELIERGYLSIQYETSILGIQTIDEPGRGPTHNITKVSPLKGPDEYIRRALERTGWERSQAKTMAQRISKYVERFPYSEYSGRETTRLLLDPRSGEIVVPAYLKQIGAESAIPEYFRFQVTEVGGRLVVESNLDFAKATDCHRKTVGPNAGEVTPALVLDALRQAFDQQFIAATLSAEIHSSPIILAAGKVALSEALASGDRARAQIAAFEDLVLDGVSLRGVLNSDKRTFDAFLKVLKRAEQFRSWVSSREPNANLLREYHRAIAKESFLEALPGRLLRYVVFTGGGVSAEVSLGGGAGVAVALAAGAADNFLVDKTRLGWKPHHFITRELLPFASPKDG